MELGPCHQLLQEPRLHLWAAYEVREEVEKAADQGGRLAGDDSPSYSQGCGHCTVQVSAERMKGKRWRGRSKGWSSRVGKTWIHRSQGKTRQKLSVNEPSLQRQSYAMQKKKCRMHFSQYQTSLAHYSYTGVTRRWGLLSHACTKCSQVADHVCMLRLQTNTFMQLIIPLYSMYEDVLTQVVPTTGCMDETLPALPTAGENSTLASNCTAWISMNSQIWWKWTCDSL